MKKILLLLLMFTVLACTKNEAAREVNREFNENRWEAADTKNFEFTLDKDIPAADISLLFSHIHDPQYATVPVAITLEGPDGKKEDIYLNVRLKDANGNDLSECAGDICDNYTTFKENVKLVKGAYKISVQNKFANVYLPNVLAVGVVVNSR